TTNSPRERIASLAAATKRRAAAWAASAAVGSTSRSNPRTRSAAFRLPERVHEPVRVTDEDLVRRSEKEPGVDDSDDSLECPLKVTRGLSVPDRLRESAVKGEVSVLRHERPRPGAVHSEGRCQSQRPELLRREPLRERDHLDRHRPALA